MAPPPPPPPRLLLASHAAVRAAASARRGRLAGDHHPPQVAALRRGDWVKLICGASFEVVAYTSASFPAGDWVVNCSGIELELCYVWSGWWEMREIFFFSLLVNCQFCKGKPSSINLSRNDFWWSWCKSLVSGTSILNLLSNETSNGDSVNGNCEMLGMWFSCSCVGCCRCQKSLPCVHACRRYGCCSNCKYSRGVHM